MTDEPRCAGCGAPLGTVDEYCLGCGTRVMATRKPTHWLWPAAGAALVAAAGAAVAIAAGGNAPRQTTIVALTPLRRTAEPAATPVKGAKLTPWPHRNGYTVVVSAVPAATGAALARARAAAAARSGLPDVGVLQSAGYASLHPGYLVVFTGVYDTLDEALAALPRAARRFRGAYAQQIIR